MDARSSADARIFQKKFPPRYIPQNDQCIAGDHFESFLLWYLGTPPPPSPQPPLSARHGSPEGEGGGPGKGLERPPPPPLAQANFPPTPAERASEASPQWTAMSCPAHRVAGMGRGPWCPRRRKKCWGPTPRRTAPRMSSETRAPAKMQPRPARLSRWGFPVCEAVHRPSPPGFGDGRPPPDAPTCRDLRPALL